MRYPSKRDAWLVLVIWLAIGGTMAASFGASRALPPIEAAFALGASVLVVAFMLSVLYGTFYQFEGDTLRIRSGPFRMNVPLAEVRAVTPTRNPLSSPACSLDRLRIEYGTRSVMISPADKEGFLATLRARCPLLS